MADIICRWRNGTPQTVVELVKSLPHKTMPNDEFRLFMNNSIWGSDFFRTPYQLACQLGLYYESDDGYYYPRFDHDIDLHEAQEYLEFWMPRYYVPNPYVGKNGFNGIECPTYMLSELYKYAKNHPNCLYTDAYRAVFHEEANNNNDIVRNYINNFSKVLRFEKNGQLSITDINPNTIFDFMDRNDKKEFFDNFTKKTKTTFDTNIPLQQIFYGAPGTGKSHEVNETTKIQPEENVFRTTFHPDSDYSTFVGCYKPTKVKTRKEKRMNLSMEDLAKELGSYYSNEDLGKISGIQKFCFEYYPYIDGEYMSVNVTKLLELAGIPKDYNVEINKYIKFCHLFPKHDPSKITYEFVPQIFTKAYLRAWQTEEPVFLVIEEINRGNCAQIFGDLFQLLA